MKSIWTSAIIATLTLSGCMSDEGAIAQDPVPVLTEDPGPITPPSSVKFAHYFDSNGRDYTYHVERDFAILEGSSVRLIMRNDCAAFSSDDENGTWAWANGGFVVEFPNRSFGFPRQDQPVPGGYGCQM
ncbi:MAG: hypothetical protein OSA49_10100 [Ascidiaceihabitans sp.]|nr:hypothetical protein [Ascidiaceihabitans sp.]